ncbi:hypothetical protein E1284_13205, partial [Actinomadura bangladeshensis]
TVPGAPLPHYLRTSAQIWELFGGLTLMPPGLVPCGRWRRGRSARPDPPVRILAGHAMKGIPSPLEHSQPT